MAKASKPILPVGLPRQVAVDTHLLAYLAALGRLRPGTRAAATRRAGDCGRRGFRLSFALFVFVFRVSLCVWCERMVDGNMVMIPL